MFDFVHYNKKMVQIVLALIILPFAFWGVDSYRPGGGAEPVAKVNKEKISPQEFDFAMRQRQNRMRQAMGDKFDQTLFDQPETKHSVLENLVLDGRPGLRRRPIRELARALAELGARVEPLTRGGRPAAPGRLCCGGQRPLVCHYEYIHGGCRHSVANDTPACHCEPRRLRRSNPLLRDGRLLRRSQTTLVPPSDRIKDGH